MNFIRQSVGTSFATYEHSHLCVTQIISQVKPEINYSEEQSWSYFDLWNNAAKLWNLVISGNFEG